MPALSSFLKNDSPGELKKAFTLKRRGHHDDEISTLSDAINQMRDNLGSFVEQENELRSRLTKEIKSKDKFLSILSHDLRSPLGSFVNLTRMLSDDFDSLSRDAAIEISQELQKSSESLYNMIENLLDWSNLERRAADYKPETIFPEDLVSANIELFSSTAKQKGIEIINKCESCGPVYADRQMIDSVIRNLLSNALKFTPSGGQITLDMNREGEMVSVMVKDSGPGIKAELVQKILNAETVESTRGTGNEKGSGLGLSLCREFIEVNRGTFDIRRAAGGGTEAVFSLPAAAQ